VAERLFGIETEYALFATDARGARMNQAQVLDGLMRNARNQLPHLPDELSHGLFLQNGARFYVDCGGHPEFTTPECSNPWDVVRYIRAGESILLRLAGPQPRQRPAERMEFFRCNVDYSGARSTWGSHESYMHRVASPGMLAKHMIPHLLSRLIYTGAGGFENTSSGVEFTLSPRTAHISAAISGGSTSNRGIFHEKDEDLCGGAYHRLHIICGESLCSELATWLRIGTTALVVAMCEAGLNPGDAVVLGDPVGAMRLFAGDPTCSATIATAMGRRLTAIDIQRHYLEQAEAHVGDDFMPPWAAEVCRQWRAVLDCLGGGWESAVTTLDWAIKLGLYRDQVRRRGMTWQSLEAWSHVMGRLAAAWSRAKQRERPFRAEAILGRASPIAAEVKDLTPTVRSLGLSWDGLASFLDVRNELFEADTRFGQLGDKGIFAALDAAGVLTHRVAGVDNVEHAVEHPPEVARARLRGRLVRELSGKDGRYCCDWEGVWDCESGKCVDLTDPFEIAPEWQDWPASGEVMPPWSFLPDAGERLASRGLRRRMRAGMGTPDPLELNQTALELRKRDCLEEAERLLRQAIEIEDRQVVPDSPKRPHRRNNLAIVLMRSGKLGESRQLNAEAWKLKARQHDLTSGRILFVRIALGYLLDRRDASLYVGQLKVLLNVDPLECFGGVASTWDIPDVLGMLREGLPRAAAEFLVQVAETLNDRTSLPSLQAFAAWNDAPGMPLESRWPDD
jgi:proteasome accessory factor A